MVPLIRAFRRLRRIYFFNQQLAGGYPQGTKALHALDLPKVGPFEPQLENHDAIQLSRTARRLYACILFAQTTQYAVIIFILFAQVAQ